MVIKALRPHLKFAVFIGWALQIGNFPRSWTENYGFDQPTMNLTMNNEIF